MEGTTRPVHPTSVLLADDDVRFRAIVRSLLESDGYQVVAEAGDAHQTVAEAERVRPDVVVVDLVMVPARSLQRAWAHQSRSSAGSSPPGLWNSYS